MSIELNKKQKETHFDRWIKNFGQIQRIYIKIFHI